MVAKPTMYLASGSLQRLGKNKDKRNVQIARCQRRAGKIEEAYDEIEPQVPRSVLLMGYETFVPTA